MKARIIVAMLGASAILGLGACQKNDSMNNADREFMDRMAYTHNGEVEFGNLAMTKGSDASVKSYAQMMVSEHNMAMAELKTLAGQRNYKLPSNPDLEHIALKIVLEQKSGRAFDSIYIVDQVKDHKQALEIIDDEVSKGKDDGLKSYANKYRSKTVANKSMAEAIVATMGF